MNIRNWALALSDIDFGWDPRALAQYLKSLLRKIHIGRSKKSKRTNGIKSVWRKKGRRWFIMQFILRLTISTRTRALVGHLLVAVWYAAKQAWVGQEPVQEIATWLRSHWPAALVQSMEERASVDDEWRDFLTTFLFIFTGRIKHLSESAVLVASNLF